MSFVAPSLYSPFFEIASVFVCFDLVASGHRKRESRHHVNGCCASRNRLHYLACHTTADRTAAHRKSDRHHVYLCAGGFRKRASLIALVMRHSITKSFSNVHQ